MKYLKFLTTSLVIFGAGTIINCYGMESEQLINNSDKLSSDERCYTFIGPILYYGEDVFLKSYSKCEPMKCTIKYLVEVCTQNAANLVVEKIIALATICNRIVSALFDGSQIQYKTNNYAKDRENSYTEYSKNSGQKDNELLYSLDNSGMNLARKRFGPEQKNDSVVLCNKKLAKANITVSSDFLKQFDSTIKFDSPIKDDKFKLFDNPNYLTQDIHLVKFFKYLGNRILQLARHAVNTMYDAVKDPNLSNQENKTSYLEKVLFADIIEPFYENLYKIKDNLYVLSDNIEKYISYTDYDKDTLKQQLKSTADYINDVLNSHDI